MLACGRAKTRIAMTRTRTMKTARGVLSGASRSRTSLRYVLFNTESVHLLADCVLSLYIVVVWTA
jgi:hypothetical protein